MQEKQTTRIDAPAEWRSTLTGISSGFLLYETVTGLAIMLLPFSPFNQFNVLLHTVLGIAMIIPVIWYCIRHWAVRRKGKLSHYQLLGYISVALLLACFVSGIVLTWQGIVGPVIGATWDMVHLVSGFAMAVFIIIHLLSVVIRKINKEDSKRTLSLARGQYYRWSVGVTALFFAGTWIWSTIYTDPPTANAFAEEYNWKYGEDRPFAPSLARTDTTQWQNEVRSSVLALIPVEKHNTFNEVYEEASKKPVGLFAQIREASDAVGVDEATTKLIDVIISDAADWMQKNGALDPKFLTGSDRCGTSGCHTEIYEEWLPSAHRYSSLDKMFQDVQTLMVDETSPEHTRYCGGCHDPISLFAGAKHSSNNTLGVEEGIDEGTSCLVCHNIVQTDLQGN
ncbi:MAG: cytochrome b/b6 domain-containing protein, partial [Phycisphaerales bacterium]|nr:cytochrome b/b6 domain-containing protein [Phycisphaerales bacterium]